jgi:hypothetical protein
MFILVALAVDLNAPDYGVTLTHGFFFSMGGFASRAGHHPITTVAQLRELSLGPEYRAAIRRTRRADIMDKSKGDGLSKGIALLQGLWFIVQIMARFAQGLPVSELEVATLAFAVVNIFTWLIWWHKPLDVQEPILIGEVEPSARLLPITIIRADSDPLEDGTSDFSPLLASFAHADAPNTTASASASTSTISTTTATPAPAARHLTVFETIFQGPVQGTYTGYDPHLHTAVPAFWASPDAPSHTPFAGMLVAVVFGTIHCAAWAAAFPSAPERALWRVSAVGVAVYPALLAIPHLLWRNGRAHDHVPLAAQVLGIGLYAVLRIVLIVLAVTTVRTLDKGWFVDVDWTVYIPHL